MDQKNLLTIIDKFAASGLAELQLDNGTFRLLLRRDNPPSPNNPVWPSGLTNYDTSTDKPVNSPLVKVNSSGDAASTAASPKVSPSAGATEAIVSPIVATFYRSPSPDAPAFAEVGKKLQAGDTLCILEAMKMLNQLEAEFDCRILAVKVENGALVEYGQTLFEVERL